MTKFSNDRPIDWKPGEVDNPDGILDEYFTKISAWEHIATQLENGHPVETVKLREPPGAEGYVMKIDIEPGKPRLYIKLQLGPGKIIGRGFHYSYY